MPVDEQAHPLLAPDSAERIVDRGAARRFVGRQSARAATVDAAAALALCAGLVALHSLDAVVIAVLAAISLSIPAGMAAAGRYRRSAVVFGERWLDDVPALVAVATGLAWSGGLVLTVAGHETALHPALVLWWALLVPVMLVARAVAGRGRPVQRVVIVGAGTVGHAIAQRLSAHPEYRVHVQGFIDDDPMPGIEGSSLQVLGTIDELEMLAEKRGIDRVILAFSRMPEQDAISLVRRCTSVGLQVDIVPRLFEVAAHRPYVSLVEGVPLESMPPPGRVPGAVGIKRIIDVAAAAGVLALLAPLLTAVAVAVRVGDGGPVLFRQDRVGRHGRSFRMLKFRTMRVGSELAHESLAREVDARGTMKLRDDPRITPIGALLRRLSIDELPQLLNVVRGDMSLVGPRPLPVYEAIELPGWAAVRHDVRPGVTGLWQVLGRSEIGFDERLRLDWLYVRHWSLGLDVRLLARTFNAVRSGRGAF